MSDLWTREEEYREPAPYTRPESPGGKEYQVDIRVHLEGHVFTRADNQKEAMANIRAAGNQGHVLDVHGLPFGNSPQSVSFCDSELSVVKGGVSLTDGRKYGTEERAADAKIATGE